MMGSLKTLVCQQCRGSTPVTNLKLFPKDAGSTVLVCDGCSNLMRNRVKGRVESQQPVSQIVAPAKEKMVCLACNYHFMVDIDRAGVYYKLRCQYCGRDDKLRFY